MWLIDQGIRALAREPNVLRLDAPVRVVGDLHGQFFDLLSMVEMCGLPREGEPGGFLFLGDYVDRGAYSCEVMLYLLSLKLAYPKHVHLLRGNHECRSLTGHFGFKAECKAKYGLPVYYRFLRLFEELPLCAVVTSDVGRYLCAHGGLSPDLASIEEVDALQRRGEPPMSGPLCDLLWADPADDPGCCPPPGRMTTAELGALLGAQFAPNRLRGCSVSFGYAAAVEFLERNDLLCLIRAHAVQEGGYYRHFEDAHQRHHQQCSTAEAGGAADAAAAAEGEEAAAAAPPLSEAVLRSRSLPAVITVFSAPNYCGRYGNK
ncbi:Metallo-dependent phosphatase-like protein [Tribonema minus]|uniref:Serine/threonine-protein phosphatase n=1 Tax=Tribonema minus TaxID=303371 RepID=A0A835Z1Z6_9STRA|nr:Metallo-dependent phosphatase-like protein [Tribonema minus]